jgi:hypothetical protein
VARLDDLPTAQSRGAKPLPHGGYIRLSLVSRGTAGFVLGAPEIGAEIAVPAPPATRSLRVAQTHKHATVIGGAIAIDRRVADLPSFLSAFVLAQPSPRAVFGSG